MSQVFDALLAIDSSITCQIGRRSTEAFFPPHAVSAILLGAPQIDEDGLRPGGTWGNNAGRQLAVRHFNVEWQVNDGPQLPGLVPDFTNSNSLAVTVMRQCRLAKDPSGQAYAGGIQFSGEEWIDQADGGDSLERSGSVIKFLTTFAVPLYDTQPQIIALTATPRIVTTVTELDQSLTFSQGP